MVPVLAYVEVPVCIRQRHDMLAYVKVPLWVRQRHDMLHSSVSSM